VGGVALIRKEHDGETLWLAQWNPKWRSYHFVSGHKLPHESFRECVAREVTEELGLREKSDFLVADEPSARVAFTAQSASAGVETAYTFELFDVQLTGSAQQQVDANPLNRWLSENEVRSHACRDGRPISTTMAQLLDAVEQES
jgi:8-oxo-dGTP pyrophosphatase MutT (NUDIX family)